MTRKPKDEESELKTMALTILIFTLGVFIAIHFTACEELDKFRDENRSEQR